MEKTGNGRGGLPSRKSMPISYTYAITIRKLEKRVEMGIWRVWRRERKGEMLELTYNLK